MFRSERGAITSLAVLAGVAGLFAVLAGGLELEGAFAVASKAFANAAPQARAAALGAILGKYTFRCWLERDWRAVGAGCATDQIVQVVIEILHCHIRSPGWYLFPVAKMPYPEKKESIE